MCHRRNSIEITHAIMDADSVGNPFINTQTGTMLGEERFSIGAGQHQPATITVPIDGSGMTTIQAIVDPLHRVQEANEKNNSAKTVLYFIAEALTQSSGPPSVQGPQNAGNISMGAKSNLFIPKVSPCKNDTGAPEPPPGGNAWGFDFSCSVDLENSLYKVNLEELVIYFKNDVSETSETNNYSEPFRVKFFKPNLPAKTADLVCFPETKNGVFYGDGTGVKVLVSNNGQSDSAPCTIGVGSKDPVLKGSNIKWVGKATVPKIFSRQHVYVTIPGQFQNLPAEKFYIVAVDIDDEIDEQGHEDNNLSKPFKYNISSGFKATLPPQGKSLF